MNAFCTLCWLLPLAFNVAYSQPAPCGSDSAYVGSSSPLSELEHSVRVRGVVMINAHMGLNYCIVHDPIACPGYGQLRTARSTYLSHRAPAACCLTGRRGAALHTHPGNVLISQLSTTVIAAAVVFVTLVSGVHASTCSGCKAAWWASIVVKEAQLSTANNTLHSCKCCMKDQAEACKCLRLHMLYLQLSQVAGDVTVLSNCAFQVDNFRWVARC